MNLFDVYPLFDIEIVKGRDCLVYDSKGTEYLDLYGGHAVISVGHANSHVVNAITHQAKELGFYSNSVINPLQKRLAEALGAISGYDDYSLFLVNSGAEANENALKLASFHTGRKRIIAIQKAFHGRTSAAVEATDNPTIQAPINSNGHVIFIPMNDVEALENELSKHDVAAFIIEAVQGVGGIKIADFEYLQKARQLTQKYGTVFIADEIQCGYGRTGKFFAHQWADIRPDLITVAKGIANGFPMGGVLVSPIFEPKYGQLGTTFGGNHLACAAAIAVIECFKEQNIIENARIVGDFLMSELGKLNGLKDVRGKGLMIGIEMSDPVKELRRKLIYDDHIFTGVSGANIIRLLPPLTLTKEYAQIFIDKFSNYLPKP